MGIAVTWYVNVVGEMYTPPAVELGVGLALVAGTTDTTTTMFVDANNHAQSIFS